MILVVAQDLIGIKISGHAEYHPDASTLFVSKRACSLAGPEMVLQLNTGSMVPGLYGSNEAAEG